MVTTKLIANIATTAGAISQENPDGVNNPSSYGLRNAIVRDASGRLWVAIFRTSTTAIEVLYSDDDGTVWNLDVTIATVNDGREGLQIHLDQDQEPWILWFNRVNGHLKYSRRIGPGNWSAIADAGSTAWTAIVNTANGTISACIGSDDALHIFILDSASIAVNGWYVTNSSGVFTTTKVWTDSAGCDSISGVIAADSLGYIHLFYRYRQTSPSPQGNHFRYIRKANAAAFPELNHIAGAGAGVEDILTDTDTLTIGTPSEMNDLAVDTGGAPHLVWVKSIGSSPRAEEVYYARKVAGVWTIELIEADLARSHYCPSIAVSKFGVIYVAWNEFSTSGSGDDQVVLAIRTTSWAISVLIGGAGQNKTWPNLLHHKDVQVGVFPGIAKFGAMGVYCDHDVGAGTDYKLFITDDWLPDDGADLVTQGPPSCAAEPDRASLALSGEGSASLTYPLAPDFAFAEVDRFDTSRATSEKDYETTFARRATNRRRWRIEHRNITKTQRDTVVAFIQARLGPQDAFNFTHPETGATIKVHVLVKPEVIAKSQPNVYTVRTEFEELF